MNETKYGVRFAGHKAILIIGTMTEAEEFVRLTRAARTPDVSDRALDIVKIVTVATYAAQSLDQPS